MPAKSTADFSLFRIESGNINVSRSTVEFRRLRRQFQTSHFVLLKGFLAPSALKLLQAQLEGGKYRQRAYQVSRSEVVNELVAETKASGFLRFVLNDADFKNKVAELSGTPALRKFVGRLYKFEPGTDQHFGWHRDLGGGRMIGLSVNLSLGRFSGGHLQIRHPDSDAVSEVHNTGPGDAILFRSTLEHRVLPVKGKRDKLAFAGWFSELNGPAVDIPFGDYRVR